METCVQKNAEEILLLFCEALETRTSRRYIFLFFFFLKHILHLAERLLFGGTWHGKVWEALT